MTTLGVVAAPHHLAADIGASLLQREEETPSTPLSGWRWLSA